jgi:hypothetical protein
MDIDQIKNKIRLSIKQFNLEKQLLYSAKVHEVALSHRLALHLENQFTDEGYVVDCEYNKNLGKPKMSDNDIKIRPDIIIHKRGTNEFNLAIIELKKGSCSTMLAKKDIQKLVETENLNYTLKVFVGVLKLKTEVVWVDGTENVEQFN